MCRCRSRYALNYREGEETFLGILPFFHIYGKVVIVLAGLVSGAKIVILPKFEPKLFLDTLQNHGVSSTSVSGQFGSVCRSAVYT